MIQGDKVDYGKLEEALKKNNLNDLKSGITLTSEAIDQHEMNAELYLFRAKFSLKMVRSGIVYNICSYILFPSLLSYCFKKKQMNSYKIVWEIVNKVKTITI